MADENEGPLYVSLIDAIYRNEVPVVKQILDNGFNVNERMCDPGWYDNLFDEDYGMETMTEALLYLIPDTCEEILQMFIEAGADFNDPIFEFRLEGLLEHLEERGAHWDDPDVTRDELLQPLRILKTIVDKKTRAFTASLFDQVVRCYKIFLNKRKDDRDAHYIFFTIVEKMIALGNVVNPQRRSVLADLEAWRHSSLLLCFELRGLNLFSL
jgi:hypothetical protein